MFNNPHLMTVNCFCVFQMNVVNATMFYDALREWRRCQREIESMADALPLTCTACGLNPHAVHVDGNRKLYRFKRTSQ